MPCYGLVTCQQIAGQAWTNGVLVASDLTYRFAVAGFRGHGCILAAAGGRWMALTGVCYRRLTFNGGWEGAAGPAAALKCL
jgi:hypothetical protein